MRGPHDRSPPPNPRSSITNRLDVRSRRLSVSVTPSARVRRPGPRHRSTGRRALCPHQGDPLHRLQRANQHGGRMSFGLGDCVYQAVDAVIQIHVGQPGRPVEGSVPFRRPRCRMARGIAFADVGLDLHDHPGGHATRGVMHEDLTEQFSGDGKRGPVIKRPRQYAPGLDVANGPDGVSSLRHVEHWKGRQREHHHLDRLCETGCCFAQRVPAAATALRANSSVPVRRSQSQGEPERHASLEEFDMYRNAFDNSSGWHLLSERSQS